MKLELTLKHLAPYLPYGLKIVSPRFKNNRFMGGMINDETEVCIDAVLREQYKPILRPLSDLTSKEIQKYYHLKKEPIIISKKSGVHTVDGGSFVTWELDIKIPDYEFGISLGELFGSHPLCSWNLLFSFHIDIFGLIEKGLAIDKKN